MTDEAPATQNTDENPQAGTGRGRPRPQATIERDNRVIAWLREQKDEAGAFVGKTRDEIAKALDIKGNEVYLSIFRLNRDGKVQKGVGSAHAWAAKTDADADEAQAAPAEAPAE